MARCPGQDMRYWTPDDIFDVACPFCERDIEFWKDEPVRVCSGCGMPIRNPRIDLGCAKWCKSAKECLGTLAEEHLAAAPLIETVRARLAGALKQDPDRMRTAEAVHAAADTLLSAEGGDPCVVKIVALLAGAGCRTTDPFLDDASVDHDRKQAVQDILSALEQGRLPRTPEAAIVHDALAVATQRNNASHGEAETTPLLTRSGRLLAQRRASALKNAPAAIRLGVMTGN